MGQLAFVIRHADMVRQTMHVSSRSRVGHPGVDGCPQEVTIRACPGAGGPCVGQAPRGGHRRSVSNPYLPRLDAYS